MINEPFVIERTYQAPISKVWEAITNKAQMKQWYFDLAEFKPEVGFEFSFEGGPEDRQYLHRCRVTEVIPGKKLAYTWRYEGYDGDSLVTWELFNEAGATRLRLTHAGLETFPANPDFAKTNFVQGWTDLIGTHLKEYLGKDNQQGSIV
ncbi:SRPBCC domain-containing protein [Segetibacter sp. 3557_3]|uniref:SRPBCC family protein n=1 Tax=Segetibacter sp. 3557_3 TaxID=2547429 RepID=UPI0010583D2A|nr:SRPBCC domain-containing protein [Segetibacter sp. 3557_3]TDH20639.1 SRPBCC domain-containing protein [Segetibacter sp. 3557_3]